MPRNDIGSTARRAGRRTGMPEDDDERILEQKRQALQEVYDRHDTLVREMFHMEHFKTMVAYNPMEAKHEESTVFREYKAKFDLEHTEDGEAGPSRRTRRSQKEKSQLLSISAPLPTAKKTKKKPLDSSAIWDILAKSKKGKGKASADVQSSVGTASTSAEPAESISVAISMGRRKRRATPQDSVESLPADKFPQKRTISEVPAPRKRLKSEQVDDPGGTKQPNGVSTRVSTRRKVIEQLVTPISAPAPTTKAPQPPPPLPRPSPIKRIKLIVRRPPPSYSNPAQKPLQPKHNHNLTTFLSSYTCLNDQDVAEHLLERRVSKEAALRNRIAYLQKQGGLVPKPDDYDLENPYHEIPNRPETKDPWTHVVDAVIAYRRPKPSGKRIAGDIALKVQAYWVEQAAKQDKLRNQEGKKLRALAKSTIKAVVAEWKKAVFHIREQARLKLESEERKRGERQLDAILDQSGHILETQHGDLTRGDLSRSRSNSVKLHGWGSEGEDQDEDEDASEDEDEEAEEEAEEEEAEREGEDGPDLPQEDEDVEPDDGTTHDPTTPQGSQSQTPRSGSISPEPSQPHTPLLTSQRRSESASAAPSQPQTPLFTPPRPNGSVSAALSQPQTPLFTPQGPDWDASSAIAVDEMITQDIESSPEPEPSSPSQSQSQSRSHSPANLTRFMLASTQPSRTHSPLNEDARNQPPKTQTSTPLKVARVLEDEGLNGHAESGPGTPAELEETTLGPDVMDTNPDEREQDADDSPAQGMDAQDDGLVQELDAQDGPVEEPVDDDAEGKPDEEDNPPELDGEDSDVDNGQPEVSDEEQPPEDMHEATGQSQDKADDQPSLTTEVKIPDYLKPFAVAPVVWDPNSKILQPLLLRGNLRPYQQAGLEWLATMHKNNMNGILADEMGLGKTIQTISLLAHLACDRGIWGPHLIIVPTSVLLNWEMEFKKFLPGFKILSYHGTTKRRKELRQGWTDKYHFNVCITSYTLASRDAHIFKRKSWYYMVLDEAHMIKNFKSQRWNILLMFRSFRRLLLTGTPLQNNLTELWALLQFLMSGSNFANLKEFSDWFSNPLEKAIEMGNILDDENMQRVAKLHTVLRPYLLRRLKRDVEKELPSKFEHLVFCTLSKRQRFLYDEFMSRAHTKEALRSGVYQKIANILMQLRKVCNHPDLFEVRPIVTSFAMEKSAIADFEIKELLIRRQLLQDEEEQVNLELLGLRFINRQSTSLISAIESRRLDATYKMPFVYDAPGVPPPKDTRTIEGFRAYTAWQTRAKQIAHWSHLAYLNRLRLNAPPIYSEEFIVAVQRLHTPILPLNEIDLRTRFMDTVQSVHSAVKSYITRAEEMAPLIDRFAFATPPVVALDVPRIAFRDQQRLLKQLPLNFDAPLHRSSVKLQIAFPDPSLLQYDCGKLQVLTRLLREKKAKGSRVLIFTQMTRILDVLEIFLNFHGYLYLRLDGATKIEDRQYITERFNADSRVFCFIASSRSGGVGINLTGADTVIFYDSDFNPQMDRQCEDRAHRIGQIRDVHIYRFVSQHTVEEALLRKANQKRSLDDLVIQKGEFDWRSLFSDENALTKALGEFEDQEDAHAAEVAAREEVVMYGADEADFGGDAEGDSGPANPAAEPAEAGASQEVDVQQAEGENEEGGTIAEYMVAFVGYDYEFFKEWRL